MFVRVRTRATASESGWWLRDPLVEKEACAAELVEQLQGDVGFAAVVGDFEGVECELVAVSGLQQAFERRYEHGGVGVGCQQQASLFVLCEQDDAAAVCFRLVGAEGLGGECLDVGRAERFQPFGGWRWGGFRFARVEAGFADLLGPDRAECGQLFSAGR